MQLRSSSGRRGFVLAPIGACCKNRASNRLGRCRRLRGMRRKQALTFSWGVLSDRVTDGCFPIRLDRQTKGLSRLSIGRQRQRLPGPLEFPLTSGLNDEDDEPIGVVPIGSSHSDPLGSVEFTRPGAAVAEHLERRPVMDAWRRTLLRPILHQRNGHG